MSFGTRIDRAIAGGRVLLAVFALTAIWLDPSQPAKFAELTYALMAGYTAFAFFILAVVLLRPLPSERVALLTHIADLTAVSTVMYLTEGSTSPFFVFFTFSLLAATLRWGWKSVLWTAAASITVLVLLGMGAGVLGKDPDFELDRFIIRSVYLAVAGAVLAFLAAHEQQLRAVIGGLASRLPTLRGDSEWPLREALGFAAEVLGVSRILIAWSEEDEPWQQLAFWSGGVLVQRSEAPDRFDPLVAADLAAASFFTFDSTDRDAVQVHQGGGRFRRWEGLPIHPELCREFRIARVVSVPISMQGLDARIFLLDRVFYGADDVQLTELAAARIGSLFEEQRLLRRLSRAAANEERLRIARDLHDGVLQFLAGTGLHLQSISSLIKSDPERAVKRLDDLLRTVATEQAQLRTLVNVLRDSVHAEAALPAELVQTCRPLVEHLKQHWGIPVSCRVHPPHATLDIALMQEMVTMLGEAVANARRHGGASTVDIRATVGQGEIEISVTDDGHGFPYHGRFDLAELRDKGLGPRSLCERVAALGGRLFLETAQSGSRIEIHLPRLSGPVENFRAVEVVEES